jgi:hypothetical protein
MTGYLLTTPLVSESVLFGLAALMATLAAFGAARAWAARAAIVDRVAVTPGAVAVGVGVSPVFLLAPLALLVRRRAPQVTLLAVFAVAYTFYWSLTTTQVRFLIPMLPVMAILVAVAVSDRLVWLGRTAVALCVAISIFLGLDIVLSTDPGRYWRGEMTAEQFLTAELGPYSIYMEANRVMRPGDRVYLVNMRTWGYLLDMPGRDELWPFPNGWRSDYTFEHFNLQRALVGARTPADIDEFFASRGITHVMIDEEITLGAHGFEERERTIFGDYFGRRATLMYRTPRDRRQSLWKLDLTPAVPRP